MEIRLQYINGIGKKGEKNNYKKLTYQDIADINKRHWD